MRNIFLSLVVASCATQTEIDTIEQRIEKQEQTVEGVGKKYPVIFSVDEITPEDAESLAHIHNVPVTVEDTDPRCPYKITYLPNGMEEGNGGCY